MPDPSVDGRGRLVEAVLLQVAPRLAAAIDFICGVVQPADQALDRAEVARAPSTGCVICHSPPFFSNCIVRAGVVDLERVDLVAVDLEDGLVAQVERATC